MIELRPFNYNDEQYDNCGNTTHAILKVGTISIPLCDECIEDLKHCLSEYDKTIFCYKCNHFIPSMWGFSYNGSCKHRALKKLDTIEDDSIGYKYAVGSMETCQFAELKP